MKQAQKHLKVKFIYIGDSKPNSITEKFITKVVNLLQQILVLPNYIEFQFEDIGNTVYGMTMLDPRFPNRIRLNKNLTLEEIILPLTHELVHLHQIYTNRLQTRSGGRILWDGQIFKVDSLNISYEDYLTLPWEEDATKKQVKLLEFFKFNSKKIKSEIDKEFAQNTTQIKPNMS